MTVTVVSPAPNLKPVARFVHTEDGLEATVYAQTEGGFRVILRDTDADQVAEVKIFTTAHKDPAAGSLAYAEALVPFGGERVF